MALNDQVFDVLLILIYLATPLVWAGALFYQDANRTSIRRSK